MYGHIENLATLKFWSLNSNNAHQIFDDFIFYLMEKYPCKVYNNIVNSLLRIAAEPEA